MARDLNQIVRDVASLSAADQELLARIVVGRVNRATEANRPHRAPTQEHDLHDLTEALHDIAEKLSHHEQREVLEQAALGLALLQSVGLWPLFQRWWRERDEELSGSQRARLRSVGIKPDG